MGTRERPADVGSLGTAAPTASVRVVATSRGDHLLLEVVGEADLYSAQELRDQLAAALTCRPRSVTLEVSRLTYCDRAGLDALNDFCAEASVVGVPPLVHGLPARPVSRQAHPPATDGMPGRAGGSTARQGPPAEHARWAPGGAHPGAARADPTATPRPWPER